MPDWMQTLAQHYQRTRRRHPEDRLMILFDIDGTILDLRFVLLHTLLAFDRAHGTRHFEDLRPEDIAFHEDALPDFLSRKGLDASLIRDILDWHRRHRWSPEAVLASHYPFQGVMDVIRWFQLQPRTFEGLNTGTPDRYRETILGSLNELGREYRVHFPPDLLYMNPGPWDHEVPDSKVAGLQHFRRRGFRVFAVVDDVEENLRAMARAVPDEGILFLRADVILATTGPPVPPPQQGPSDAAQLPQPPQPPGRPQRRPSSPTAHPLGGRRYDIRRLIGERDLPRHVQFVWHGINDTTNLARFLESPVSWAECDVRRAPGGRIVLRHDPFQETPWRKDEKLLGLEEMLDTLHAQGRSVKLDLKEDGDLLEEVLTLVGHGNWPEDRLWFNAKVETLGRESFRRLARDHPGVILQCPVDFLAPLVAAMPERAREVLEELRSWGINRLSLGWKTEAKRHVLHHLQEWGYEVNIYDVPDLQAFLEAVLLLPRSVTADFNFPEWNYFGRGAGKAGRYHEYPGDAGVGR
jgi:hypothetical protein